MAGLGMTRLSTNLVPAVPGHGEFKGDDRAIKVN